MHVLSETEALLELSESVDVERVIVSLAAIDMWIGQEVSVVVRRATAEEIQKSQKTVEDALNGNPGDAHGDARLFRMMEDIYRLAASPNGEALRIPNFSGTIPPPKNEATFTQWSYEVKEALDRFPENTVRNWILRSVRGSAADSIRSLGPRASVAAILHKLETMHGTVAPFDVMMRRLFNLVQGKTESVSTFATRLETAMANIQSDHPGRLTRASIEASMRDRFYQGLKKSYKEPLRYLYDTGSPYEAILIASRRVEAEMEHHKESEPAHAKQPKKQIQVCGVNLHPLKLLSTRHGMLSRNNASQVEARRMTIKAKDRTSPLQPEECMLWMWWSRSLHKRMPQPKRRFFKLQKGRKEEEGLPINSQRNKQEGSWDFNRRDQSRGRSNPRGWPRPGVEPESVVYINFVPVDSILDVGSSMSFIDVELCIQLNLVINPFPYDMSHSQGVVAASITSSFIAILGWVEIELGVLGLGCVQARLWVTDCAYHTNIPIVLGGYLIKKIFAQATLGNFDVWTPHGKLCMNGILQVGGVI